MSDNQYWGAERRHCNRMIAVVFFGSLSSVALIIEFLGEVSGYTALLLTILMLGGSSVWIGMYALHRETTRENDEILREGELAESGILKVIVIPVFYFILAAIVGVMVL